jgi:coproporphyrinogen III oxidase-like Fe-S oxidoreductase
MVYWNMENYLGLWVTAASFLKKEEWKEEEKEEGRKGAKAVRWTNTANFQDYLAGKWKDEASVQELNEKDILIESFFLKLRTSTGISEITHYQNILVPNYVSLLEQYKQWGLVHYNGRRVQLTDQGMDVSNSIITDLLQSL